ncbi:MAG: TldD/PmbA family protein [Planctomycetes bacterium]|nr:TldD/PmbA family protein [Planctomycetota bacterium]
MIDQAFARAAQRAMEREIARSMKSLRMKGHPRPYYISQSLRFCEHLDVWGRYGAIFNSETSRQSQIYAEVRVGSYRLDQTVDGSLTNDLSERESYHWLYGPQDLDPDALRYAFWRLTQLKYGEALQEYYDKKKILVEQHLRAQAPSFSREPRVVMNGRVRAVRPSKRRCEEFVRRTSDLFRAHRDIEDPYVHARGTVWTRVFVNSEGTKFITQDEYHDVMVSAWLLTREGERLESTRAFHSRGEQELPRMREVRAAIDEIARDLRALARAPRLEPYAGPALLCGVAAGLLFHEAIGHRLEGERMIARSEGRTFAARMGQRILPAGVDLIDDPSLSSWQGTPLYGHYLIDDEGVPARPVTLVEDGVLKTFLASRAGVPGVKRSNGHGRHERFQDPMARMGNLIVRPRERHSFAELKRRLLAEVARRDLPHGIIIKNATGGETATDSYDFQAFKGFPTEVYTVDPKTGRETRVRGVNFIGTPLAAVQGILAFGDTDQVDNGYCVAESGSIPVGTVAPAMLVADLELQRADTAQYRPAILAPPPMKGDSAAGRRAT